MTLRPLSAEGRTFLVERHLATLTTLRADGTPHVAPVGFTWDAETGLARVICSGTSQKTRNVARNGAVALCQVDGRRWLTLQGTARVLADAASVADAVERYARRYRAPRENPTRVTLEVTVAHLLGSTGLFAD